MKTFITYQDREGNHLRNALCDHDMIDETGLYIGCTVEFCNAEEDSVSYTVCAIGEGTLTRNDEKFEVNILIVRASVTLQ